CCVARMCMFSPYARLGEAGGNRGDARIAAAAAATVAFSPLWLNLSFTFMTDVPFAAFATLSAWLYARAFRRDSRPGMLLAGVACAAALLIRQHGVWIAAAPAVAAVLAPREASSASSSIRARIGDAAAAIV